MSRLDETRARILRDLLHSYRSGTLERCDVRDNASLLREAGARVQTPQDIEDPARGKQAILACIERRGPLTETEVVKLVACKKQNVVAWLRELHLDGKLARVTQHGARVMFARVS
jgi:hypothetical protein